MMFLKPMFKTDLYVPHAREHKHSQYCRENSYRVHTESYRHTESCGNPKARSRCYSMERVPFKYDESAAEKADTGNNTGGDIQGLYVRNTEVCGCHIVRSDYKKACAHADQTECTHTGGLFGEHRTLGTYDCSQKHRKREFQKHNARGVDKLSGGSHREKFTVNSRQCTAVVSELFL